LADTGQAKKATLRGKLDPKLFREAMILSFPQVAGMKCPRPSVWGCGNILFFILLFARLGLMPLFVALYIFI
jgi:hypothetical protein